METIIQDIQKDTKGLPPVSRLPAMTVGTRQTLAMDTSSKDVGTC